MKIRIWGARGSISVSEEDTIKYGGNTCCLEVELPNNKVLIIDAGTGIRSLGQKINKENKTEIYMLITHVHLDHIRGFPFFTPIYNPSCNLYIDGHPSSEKGLKYIFSNNNLPGIFPIEYDVLKANITYSSNILKKPITLEGITIDSCPLSHPQGSLAFRFKENNKTVVFMTDNELSLDENSKGAINKFTEFCKDADVLIHDSQYAPEEYIKYEGFGHSHYELSIQLAHKANVKKLLLFHHDPTRTDEQLENILQSSLDYCKFNGIDLEIELAKEKSLLII
jgi:phosphoribosyl 1,2-cyclic phosphodiesterase